jgi:hydroxyethylthiazole kinase-like sugar kinase family protein
MFNDLSFIARAAVASVLGSGCMLAALMWTQAAPDKNKAAAAEQVVSAQQMATKGH